MLLIHANSVVKHEAGIHPNGLCQLKAMRGAYMDLIEITADCREPLVDMRSLRLEEAEVRFEDVMGHIVMKFYETVQIIEIRLHTSARSSCYSMYVRMQCDEPSSLARQRGGEFMESVLEGRLATTLTEFFEDVEVKRVTISRLPAPISKS